MNLQSDLFPDATVEVAEGKECIKCGVFKPLDHFSNSGGASYLRPECRRCNNELGRIRKILREKYGNPPEDYRCPICNKTAEQVERKGGNAGAFVIDHCHLTDNFRGWLCHSCNRALGLLADDVEMFKRAIDYLIKPT